MTSLSPRWEIGKVLGPRGLRGELKIRLFRASPSYLSAGRILIGATPFAVRKTVWIDPHVAVVTLDGVRDRTAAEALGTPLVSVERGWFTPGDGPVELLIGARAIDDATGAPLGLDVVGIDANGAQDLLVLADPAGHEHLIPYVDALVPGVAAGEGGRVDVRIRVIEGLLDLDAGPDDRAPDAPDDRA